MKNTWRKLVRPTKKQRIAAAEITTAGHPTVLPLSSGEIG